MTEPDKKTETKDEPEESPFEKGSCRCGMPNCSGHMVVDGQFEIDHPTRGKILVIVPKHLEEPNDD